MICPVNLCKAVPKWRGLRRKAWALFEKQARTDGDLEPIAPVYLLDAAAESRIIGGWLAAGMDATEFDGLSQR